MELTLRTIFYTIQILGFILPPLILFVLLGKKASRRKKAAVLAAVLLAAELSAAAAMTLHPPIVSGFAVGTPLTSEEKRTVRAVASGIYSANIPIFPCLTVVRKTRIPSSAGALTSHSGETPSTFSASRKACTNAPIL